MGSEVEQLRVDLEHYKDKGVAQLDVLKEKLEFLEHLVMQQGGQKSPAPPELVSPRTLRKSRFRKNQEAIEEKLSDPVDVPKAVPNGKNMEMQKLLPLQNSMNELRMEHRAMKADVAKLEALVVDSAFGKLSGYEAKEKAELQGEMVAMRSRVTKLELTLQNVGQMMRENMDAKRGGQEENDNIDQSLMLIREENCKLQEEFLSFREETQELLEALLNEKQLMMDKLAEFRTESAKQLEIVCCFKKENEKLREELLLLKKDQENLIFALKQQQMMHSSDMGDLQRAVELDAATIPLPPQIAAAAAAAASVNPFDEGVLDRKTLMTIESFLEPILISVSSQTLVRSYALIQSLDFTLPCNPIHIHWTFDVNVEANIRDLFDVLLRCKDHVTTLTLDFQRIDRLCEALKSDSDSSSSEESSDSAASDLDDMPALRPKAGLNVIQEENESDSDSTSSSDDSDGDSDDDEEDVREKLEAIVEAIENVLGYNSEVLTGLRIKNMSYSGMILREIAAAIQENQFLEHISFKNCDIMVEPDYLDMIFEAPNFKSLDLNGVDVLYSRELAQMIRDSKKLENLRVIPKEMERENPLIDEGVLRILPANLKTLVIGRVTQGLSLASMEAFMNFHGTTLKRIALQKCNFADPIWCKDFGSSLSFELEAVEHLMIKDCLMERDCGSKLLVPIFNRMDDCLVSLTIKGSFLGESFNFRALQKFFEDNPTLEYFEFGNRMEHITEEMDEFKSNPEYNTRCGEALSSIVRECCNLRVLIIGGTVIGGRLLNDADGARILMQTMASKSLQKLILTTHTFGRQSTECLLVLLKQNTTLRELDLRNNKLGGFGVTGIYGSQSTEPPTNRALKRLNLRGNDFTSEDLESFPYFANLVSFGVDLNVSENEALLKRLVRSVNFVEQTPRIDICSNEDDIDHILDDFEWNSDPGLDENEPSEENQFFGRFFQR